MDADSKDRKSIARIQRESFRMEKHGSVKPPVVKEQFQHELP